MDRIDPALGYVPGNCQLLAAVLNAAKANDLEVPEGAIERLDRRLERVVNDRHSEAPVREAYLSVLVSPDSR